ncbi:hypothetical protein IFM58399_05454 [Aspergillus lentulus]|uniref:Uncharacterized protein n=1 Tax=Aspergillus lentulus TaxID=293939 RepID=A0ABQ1AF56_ASPLE|nr:uncharacterized protein IFM58399_05454 [Aspergillus lentulus]GFF39082.1 hypothetical protein IFM58399_05454 [Aspergillus lentulus]GFF62407.1 hypothetical protein IFM62136_05340 [Aspergillus lentulus]GFF80622.1 hypothetical protein IFM60648_05790 [Aspergillus lentulus]GFF81786.1 hypothetical protein IFM47457_05581 [Aspergillus lentulus]GFG08794.1 hypothetical protein IFM61392_05550 [Aspergillus lentulus]
MCVSMDEKSPAPKRYGTTGLGKFRCDSDRVRKAVDTRLAPVECLKSSPFPSVKTADIDAELQWMIDGEESIYLSRWTAAAGKPNEASIAGCLALVDGEMGNVPAAYSRLPLQAEGS